MKRSRLQAVVFVPFFLAFAAFLKADDKKVVPKVAAPAPKAAAPARAAAPAGHAPAGAAAAGHPAGAGAAGAAGHPGGGVTTAHPGGATTAHPSGMNNAHPGGAAPGTRPGMVNSGNRPGAGARPGSMNGRSVPAGHREVATRDGGRARLDERGRVREVHARGMDIGHGPHGERRILAERGDHSRVFAERRGYGYYQGRPYGYGGREFARRTYYANGVAYDRFYNRYPYHGIYLEAYAPSVYYAPGFYGYAYSPFVAPIPYAWGWGGNPWVSYYGGYFTPYPVYASPSLWLTDYMISTSLAASYQQQLLAANGGPPPPPAAPPEPLTPEVKQMIAEEVQRQISRENAERGQLSQAAGAAAAPVGIARALNDNTPHVFVAGSDIYVPDAAGQECGLSQGDVVQLVAPPADPNATAASLVVLASKGQDCRKGTTVSIELAELQNMQNHMRETIDKGLGDIQAKAGQSGGFPALPAAAKEAPVTAPFIAEAPPQDSNALAQIDQQVQAADAVEREVVAPAAPDGAAPTAAPSPVSFAAVPAGPPPETSLGQTIEEVEKNNGRPSKVISPAAGKKIYIYKDIKVTFTAGKVSSIDVL